MNQWVFRHSARNFAEGLDETVVGWLARSGEVENNALLVNPQIEIAGASNAEL
jgi:hypothetical protein